MLDLYFSYPIFIRYSYKCFFFIAAFFYLTHIKASENFSCINDSPIEDWSNYAFSVDEAIDFLFYLRSDFETKGYEMPLLSDLCLELKNHFVNENIQNIHDKIEIIYEKILQKEDAFSIAAALNKNPQFEILKVKKSKKKHRLEADFSDEFIFGFIKAIGGALICVIPHPVAWTVGGGLVVNGVSDMVNYAGDDQKNDSIEDKMKNYPTPPSLE